MNTQLEHLTGAMSRIIKAALLLAIIWMAALARAQETKGICKGDRVPTDRVIVGEFESSQCDPPDTLNAWDTALPMDGMAVCKNQNPIVLADENVLQFVPCELLDSEKCPSNNDQSPNAYRLRTASACQAKNGPQGERIEKATKLRLVCNAPTHLPWDETVVAQTDSPKCSGPSFVSGAKNAFLVENIDH